MVAKPQEIVNIENRIFGPIAKFGFPLVLAVFMIGIFFFSYLPRTEERLQGMITMCFSNMKDITHTAQTLEIAVNRMQDKIEQSNLCQSPKK